MTSKVAVILQACLGNKMLIRTQHEHSLRTLVHVAFPDALNKVLLLLEPFLWGFEADEGSCPNVAGRDGCVEGHDVRRDS